MPDTCPVKVKSVQVTIDGDENLHNANRPLKSGRRSYHIILKNLSIAPDAIRILIRINIDKEIFSSIETLLDDLEKFGIWPQRAKQVIIYLGFKQYYENNSDNRAKYFTPEEYSFAEEQFRKIKFEKYNKWAERNNYKKSRLAFTYPKMNPFGCKTVNSPFSFVIDCNGNITKCWDDCTHAHMNISHINEDYKKMKNKNRFKEVVTFCHFKYDKECYECKFLPICDSGNCIHRQKEKGQIKPCTSWKFKLTDVLQNQYTLSMQNPEAIQSYKDLFRKKSNETLSCE